MKTFILKMTAYHYLERNHHVCINEAGDYMNNRNSRVRYYIALDKDKRVWMYHQFVKERNDFGEFVIDGKKSYCIIHAGFDQVSKFNYN